MANAKAKLYYTKQKYLDTLPIANGNIIFVPESNTVCIDLNKQRYSYKTIQIFSTNAERIEYANPTEGFYFVEETEIF